MLLGREDTFGEKFIYIDIDIYLPKILNIFCMRHFVQIYMKSVNISDDNNFDFRTEKTVSAEVLKVLS